MVTTATEPVNHGYYVKYVHDLAPLDGASLQELCRVRSSPSIACYSMCITWAQLMTHAPGPLVAGQGSRSLAVEDVEEESRAKKALGSYCNRDW